MITNTLPKAVSYNSTLRIITMYFEFIERRHESAFILNPNQEYSATQASVYLDEIHHYYEQCLEYDHLNPIRIFARNYYQVAQLMVKQLEAKAI